MNTNELTKLITNDTVHYDMINENAIYDETYKLAKSLEFCEQIVTAAHQLADYVPDLSNDQHSEFWKQKVSIITRAEHCSALSIRPQVYLTEFLKEISLTIQ
jgi:hypothetical protein